MLKLSLDLAPTPFKLLFYYLLFTKFLANVPLFPAFIFSPLVLSLFLQPDFYLCHYVIETSPFKIPIAKSRGLARSPSLWIPQQLQLWVNSPKIKSPKYNVPEIKLFQVFLHLLSYSFFCVSVFHFIHSFISGYVKKLENI